MTGRRPYICIGVTVVSLCLTSAAQDHSPADLIRQVNAAITSREGPGPRLIEQLGDNGSPECEQALIDLLSFTVQDPSGQIPEPWRSMVAGEVHEGAAQQLIILGSPEVVPTLRRWLDEGIASVNEGQYARHMLTAIPGLGRFHDAESRAAIEALYLNPSCPDYFRKSCIRSIAMIDAPESTNLLCRILDHEEDISLETRCLIAANLVRHDVERGRQALLADYDEYLASLNREGTKYPAPRYYLSMLGDARLMTCLTERLEHEPPGSVRKNITSVLERMKTADLPIEEVVLWAQDDRWENADKRYAAIQRLGREGTMDHIQVLSSLKPWIFSGPAPCEVQQSELRRSATIAIRSIRRRCWTDRTIHSGSEENKRNMNESYDGVSQTR